MTWARVVQTGSGRLEFRLSIKGVSTEFVTNSTMERTGSSTTASRKVGLVKDGIVLEEEADILRARLKGSSISFRIKDIALKATDIFAFRPTKQAWLTADASTSDTSLTVTSTSGWSTGDYAFIGTECTYVSNVPSSTTLTVTRGVFGSTAQAHYTQDGEKLQMPIVVNKPYSFTGRDAYLYVYGEGDSLTGNGTIIWRGILSGEPSLEQNGTTWNVPCDPVSKLLQGTISLDRNATVYGIYYPWNNPLRIRVGYWNAATFTAATAVTDQDSFAVIGHYEDQMEFVRALDAGLRDVTSGWTAVFGADYVSETQYKITATLSGNVVPGVMLFESHGLDEVETDGYVGLDYSKGMGWRRAVSSDHGIVNHDYSFASGEVYELYINAQNPRGWFGKNPYNDNPAFEAAYGAYQTTYPENRMYVGGIESLTNVQSAVLDFSPGAFGGANYPGGEYDVTVNTGSRYIQTVTAVRGTGISYVGTAGVTIKLNNADWYSSATNIGDFMSWLTSQSATYANLGVVPLITTADFGSANAATLIDRIITGPGGGYRNNRKYSFVKPVKVEDLLASELQMLGCYLTTNSSGIVQVKQLTQIASTQNADFAITTSNHLVNNGFPGYEVAPSGMVNTITIKTGFNPSTGEWDGKDISVRDVSAISATNVTNTLEIKPYSSDPVEYPLSYDDAVGICQPLFSSFGVPYVVLSFDVPLTAYSSALLGNVVSFISNQLPDVDGTRGFTTAKNGIVIGRRFDMSAGYGTLRILRSLQPIAGYVPVVRITSPSGATTSWSFTADSTDSVTGVSWLPSGYTDADDWFAVGQQIAVYEWNSASPTRTSGVITACSTNSVSVTLDSATTLSSGTWLMTFDLATDSSLTTAQKAFGYIAGSDLLIDFSTATSARQYG